MRVVKVASLFANSPRDFRPAPDFRCLAIWSLLFVFITTDLSTYLLVCINTFAAFKCRYAQIDLFGDQQMQSDRNAGETPLTMSVPAAGKKYFGLGPFASYQAARRGEIP